MPLAARCYAAAAIERHAARLAPLADQARGLRSEWQEIAAVVGTIENASITARQLSEAHGRLVREAGRVYADPSQAIERLTADPQAPARLSAGQAAAYGQLNGRGAASASPTLPARRLTAPCPPCATPSMTIARQDTPPLKHRDSRAPSARASSNRAELRAIAADLRYTAGYCDMVAHSAEWSSLDAADEALARFAANLARRLGALVDSIEEGLS